MTSQELPTKGLVDPQNNLVKLLVHNLDVESGQNFNSNVNEHKKEKFNQAQDFEKYEYDPQRDQEWAEYAQFMNLPGITDGMTGEPPMPFNEDTTNGQDEAHFVQKFIQNPFPTVPQYYYSGYYPGYNHSYSPFYTERGNVLSAPFISYQVPEPQINYQDPHIWKTFSKQENETNGKNNIDYNGNYSRVLNSMSKVSIHDNQEIFNHHHHNHSQKAKPPTRSWADIANSPAQPLNNNPQPRPKTIHSTIPHSKHHIDAPINKEPKQEIKTQKFIKSDGEIISISPNGAVGGETVDINIPYARFFVIKSYSEDDVHKAIKYNIWASTDNGNKRLDAAYKESSSKGPIYLFFSVNASGQFCGMAQMMSALDYDKKCDLWALDKWKGQFQLKWIFIKDIPNPQLKHIRLENNDNKPVTNSRDTQEVLLDAGRELLKMFLTFKSKTSIIDDFTFYDKRQEQLQQKKLKSEEEENPPTGSNRSRYRNKTKKLTN